MCRSQHLNVAVRLFQHNPAKVVIQILKATGNTRPKTAIATINQGDAEYVILSAELGK